MRFVAGDLKERIVFLSVNRVNDRGFASETFNTVCAVWAQVRLAGGSNETTQNRRTAKLALEIDMRYRADITDEMRIVWRGKTFEIVSPLQINPIEGRLTLSALEDESLSLAVASITISPTSVFLVAAATQQMTATCFDENGLVVSGFVTWSSSDPTVVSIDATTGIATGVGVGGCTITASSEGKSASVPAVCTLLLPLVLDWAPLTTRSDLAQPTAYAARAGGSDGYQDSWPRHIGCNTLGISRAVFPKSVDEWGAYAPIDAAMANTYGSGDFTACTVTQVAGPYDNTAGWQVVATTATSHRLRNTILWHDPGVKDNQELTTWKRGGAVIVKAAFAGDIGKQLRIGLTDSSLVGGAPGSTTLLKSIVVTLTATWTPYYIEFDNRAQFAAYTDINVVLEIITDNTSYCYAPYSSYYWHAHEPADSSNWLRPLPWHESLGLLSQFQTQNSWGPDSDSPVLLGGASRAGTAVAAPDSPRHYGGRTLSQYTLGVGDGITTDQPYRCEHALDIYPSNEATGAIWLHWYLEPGTGALPADGALAGYVTPRGPIVNETFNRANTTGGFGTATSGQAWNEITGTGGISSNQGYWPSGNGLAVIDSGKADVTVQCTWIAAALGTQRPRLIFRLTDGNNYWLLDPETTTQLSLYKNVSGSFGSAVGTAAHTWVSGDTVKVVTAGSTISVYINGVLAIGPITDSFNATATNHGIGNVVNGASLRVENFSVIGDAAAIGPVNLVRDAYASLRRSNGGAFYRARIKVNQASEGYLDFTPKIVNASGSSLLFNGYRAAMTAEGARSYGWHNALVPKRTVTAPVYNDAAWEEIPKVVADVSVEEGIWFARFVMPYGLTDLTNLNGNATDADQSNRFSPCLWQSGPFGSADTAFNCDVNATNSGITIVASVSRGSPHNAGDYVNWFAQINNIPASPTSFPPMVPFDIALAWKNHAIVAFGIGHGPGSTITWLNNGDTFLGGTVAISTNNGLAWELDADSDSHLGVGADRDVIRQTGGFIQAIAAARTGSVSAATVKDSVAYHIAHRLGARQDYR